jgi:hypothetical protein
MLNEALGGVTAAAEADAGATLETTDVGGAGVTAPGTDDGAEHAPAEGGAPAAPPDGEAPAATPNDEPEPDPVFVAQWLSEHGYTVSAPGAAPARAETPPAAEPAPVAAAATVNPQDDLDRRFRAAWAETDDDEVRAELLLQYTRESTRIAGEAVNNRFAEMERTQARQAGLSQLSQVEGQFETMGLPKEAASDYIELVAQLAPEKRSDPQATAQVMREAVGLAVIKRAHGATAGKPAPGKIPSPRAEAPAGGGGQAVPAGVDPAVVATLRANFPGQTFTPAKIAELRKEGII